MLSNNIIVFSSGVSEKNGITGSIKDKLNDMGYVCSDWRELFSSANDADNIALLPMLIKKIPTFDFAVLICEGHDTTYISRGENSVCVKTMRDNVLFEIGLCAMAVGLNHTILVTDRDVYLPDDLRGRNGQLAVKQITVASDADFRGEADVARICEQISEHIELEKEHINQVIIGAAASGACGYASNFICRTLEHIDDELTLNIDGQVRKVFVPLEKIHMHIVLPCTLDEGVLNDIHKKQGDLMQGSVVSARNRPAEFHYYFENDELHIVDYPTNIVTSYDTAKMILKLEADDEYDEKASCRFVAKELALFETTLKTVLNAEFVSQVVEQHYSSATEEVKDKLKNNVMSVVSHRLTITRCDT